MNHDYDPSDFKSLVEWVREYKERGYRMNLQSVYKRRAASGLGTSGGKFQYLTEDEFKAVLDTPLPGCTGVKNSYVKLSKEELEAEAVGQ